MKRMKRPLTRRQAQSRLFAECSDAIDRAYHNPLMSREDINRVLAGVLACWLILPVTVKVGE